MIKFPTFQSKDGTVLIGFYPITDCSSHILKVLSWKGIDSISQKLITQKDAEYEIANYSSYVNYVLTGDNSNISLDYNFMQGAC